ncbi:hypothetical protein [Brevibacillus reuszeri]|uniref:hypothetical protein n=1 Tax=Brevibacillus reuszeri TaxID=54915 RepID=UPI003D2439E0
MNNEPVRERRVFVFLPWLSGKGFLILLLIPIFLLGMVLKLLAWAYANTLGPWINPWLNEIEGIYTAFFLGFPIILLATPEQIVSGFGVNDVSETEIQKAYSSSPLISDSSMYTNVGFLLGLLVLISVLIYFRRHGVVKGRFLWFWRFILLSIGIGIPVSGSIIGLFFTTSTTQNQHYDIIHKAAQDYAINGYICWMIVSVFVSLVAYKLIILVGRNKIERDKNREEKNRIKKEKRQLQNEIKADYY